MAVIRPPGHHATKDKASGFCLFNNVGVAVRHLQQEYGVKRVAIVDWDVHHGNGTSDIFAEDDSVLFFSVHRYDSQGFFPGTGILEDAGKSAAKGYTVNVPLDKGYGDLDVRHVIQHVLCPLLDKFKPEAIFVSAGFDAVKGDPLGGCRVSPEGYGWLTSLLHRLASHFCEGRLFLALEGGYNPDMIAQCSVECVRSLMAETSGTAGSFTELLQTCHWVPADSPTNSTPGTPAMSPKMAPRIPTEGTPTSTPRLGPGSPSRSHPTSPSAGGSASEGGGGGGGGHKKEKVKGASSKTVGTVRKVTELHNLFPLGLPIAPKANEGSAQGNKNSKKNARRKRSGSGVTSDEDGAASSDSGWAIACGESESDFMFSPAVRPLSRQPSSPHPPELELPPMPGLELELVEQDADETEKTSSDQAPKDSPFGVLDALTAKSSTSPGSGSQGQAPSSSPQTAPSSSPQTAPSSSPQAAPSSSPQTAPSTSPEQGPAKTEDSAHGASGGSEGEADASAGHEKAPGKKKKKNKSKK
eukprot:TRINITY_DN16931_c0_g1_i1.p1 TRINITY_DN16931_c0_g1~~TRINITY_DN16931_c0_g1_i1.p1  ORF type:complete len:591 (-),score=101.68 TRINITY_DN16931_c0_g1_i1:182-1759(-)